MAANDGSDRFVQRNIYAVLYIDLYHPLRIMLDLHLVYHVICGDHRILVAEVL